MLNSIESKIHNILLDIDPSLHADYEEQAIIVAEASANYRIITSKKSVKKASKHLNDEALMIDSILQTMNMLVGNNTHKYSYASSPILDDGEIDYETVLRNLRFSSQDFDMIANDDDLDSFLENRESDTSLFDIQDIFDDERPNSELYSLPKQKKHRSDSQSR